MKKNTRTTLAVLLGGVLLLLIATLGFFQLNKGNPDDLRSSYPVRQIDLLEKALSRHQSVYLSPEYYPVIPSQDLKHLPSRTEAADSMAEISKFYRLTRDRHFSLLIFGTLPSSAMIVRELIDSPRWILSDVSPWGYILVPNLHTIDGAAPWIPPTLEALSREYPDAKNRAEWLIATAENLISIRKMQEAEKLLQEAKDIAKTGKCRSHLFTAQASLAATQGRWNDALSAAREACDANPRNTTATEILIRALTECGHTDEALDVARMLTEQTKNQETLFLLARAANASNSKREEIEALRSLVSMARKQHQQLGASLTYLAQAYARDGERGQAIRAFQEAISQHELTKEQREMLKQLIEHLRPEDGIPLKN